MKHAVQLKALNMELSDGSEHPQIDLRKTYLVKVGGAYHAGRFERQWYGLNFNGIYPAGYQFDAPGTNASNWQQIWEIIPTARKP